MKLFSKLNEQSMELSWLFHQLNKMVMLVSGNNFLSRTVKRLKRLKKNN